MNVVTEPGSFDSGCAVRPGSNPAAQFLVGSPLVRLGGVRGGVLVLSLVGLLVLVLITAGCGPPN
jgi:hypothetical protein